MKRTLILTTMLLCGITGSGMADTPATQPWQAVTAFRKLKIQDCGAYRDALNAINDGYAPAFELVDADWSQDSPIIQITVKRTKDFQVDAVQQADQHVDFWRTSIRDTVENTRRAWKLQLDKLTVQFDDLQQKESAEDTRLQNEKTDLAGRMHNADLIDTSPESVHDLANALEIQRETAEIDKVGKLARKQAMTKALADLDADMTAKLQSDPIVEQLQKVVDIRQVDLDQKMQLVRTGACSPGDVNNAATALAEAKAAVLEQKEAAAKAAGADTIVSWNQELLSLSIDLAEVDARDDALEKRLTTLGDVLPQLEKQPSLNAQETNLDAMISQMQDLSSQIKRLNDNLSEKNIPKLVVVESRDEPAKN